MRKRRKAKPTNEVRAPFHDEGATSIADIIKALPDASVTQDLIAAFEAVTLKDAETNEAPVFNDAKERAERMMPGVFKTTKH